MLWVLITPESAAAMRSAVRGASHIWFLAALALMPLIQTIRAARFGRLLFGSDRRRPGLWAVTTTLLAVNTILPFKLGEASFPVMTRRLYDVPLADGTGVILFARFLDLAATLTLLGLAVMLADIDTGIGIPRWLSIAAVSLTATLSLAPFALVPAAPPNTPPAAQAGRLPSRLKSILADITRLHTRITNARTAGAIVVSSYGIWVLHALAAMCAVEAVDATLRVHINAGTSAAAGLVTNIAFALPITGVAGLGAPQAAWVALARLADIPMADAVVGAFAYTAVTLTATAVLGATGATLLSWRLARQPAHRRDADGNGIPPRPDRR